MLNKLIHQIRRIYLLLSLVLMFLLNIGWAQSPAVKIPPSPNAMAFQKFGDIPVSYNSGLPNISVPLYTITAGEITVPISLSYHASGIKVSEEASKVGLGWVLDAGGMISRSIMGGDDFVHGVAMYSPYHTGSYPELPTTQPPVNLVEYSCEPILGNSEVIYGDVDVQPDIYQYQLPTGQSGKFILKRDETVILAKANERVDIKVFHNASVEKAIKWQIRTLDGTTYKFDQFEYYVGNELLNETGPHKTAWYLTDIVSPLGDHVRFVYTSSQNYVRPVGSYSQSYSTWTALNLDFTNGSDTTGNSCGMLPPSSDSTVPGRDYLNLQLDSIVFNGGSVKLNYGSREDILNDERVESMVVLVRDGSSSDYRVIKNIAFGYEYFTGNIGVGSNEGIDFQRKRLKLKTVTEFSPNNHKGWEYKFDYQNEDTNPNTLPSKRSMARDHWGYYNGKTSRTSLVPSHYPYNSGGTDVIASSIGMLGEERNANPAYTALFSLKRIWYPTGGYTDFEMESHDFNQERSLAMDESFYSDFAQTSRKEVVFQFGDFSAGTYPANFQQALADGRVLDATKGYKDRVGDRVKADFQIFFLLEEAMQGCYFNTNYPIFLEMVSEDEQVLSSANLFELLNSPTPPSASCDIDNGTGLTKGIKYSGSYELNRGRYYYRLRIPTEILMFSIASMRFDMWEVHETIYGGGLRVKRIKSYSSPTATPMVKRFDYHYINESSQEMSYGIQMVTPAYSYFMRTPTGCEHLMRTSESVSDLFAAGSPIAYESVTVLEGENGENGKTVYKFHVNALTPNYQQGAEIGVGIIVPIPRKPPLFSLSVSPYHGLMHTKQDYRLRSPGTFQMVKEQLFEYLPVAPADTIWSAEAQRIKAPSPAFTCDNQQSLYRALISSSVYNSAIVTRDYDNREPGTGVTNPMVTRTSLVIENLDHCQISRKEEQVGDKVIIKKYKYPADYSSIQDSVVKWMKRDFFMHNALIEEQTLVRRGTTERVIGHDIITYQSVGSKAAPLSTARLLVSEPLDPASLPQYSPGSPLDNTRYQITATLNYDDQGRINSIQKLNDMFVSYQWGYNKLVTAEVINAQPNQFFYIGFEQPGEGNSNDSKVGQWSKTGGYSKLVSGLLPGKYSFTYWKKEISGWQYITSVVDVTGTFNINLTGHVDEIRLYPKDGSMTTFAHDPLVGLTEKMDANGRSTKFFYDAFGRFYYAKDNDGNITQRYDYNYKLK